MVDGLLGPTGLDVQQRAETGRNQECVNVQTQPPSMGGLTVLVIRMNFKHAIPRNAKKVKTQP